MPLIYSPTSSPLLNDFLLPLASFPLSSSALHKSIRSLHPSKANDHHLFSCNAVTFFPFLSMAHFPLPSHTHCDTRACMWLCMILVHAVLLTCHWRAWGEISVRCYSTVHAHTLLCSLFLYQGEAASFWCCCWLERTSIYVLQSPLLTVSCL